MSAAAALARIAARSLARHRRRSLLTVAAMALAVLMLVGVRGMLNAMNGSLRDSLVEGQLGSVQIHRRGYLKAVIANPLDLDLPADEAFLARVRATPHVRAVAPRIAFAGMVNAHDRSVATLLLGLDAAAEAAVCPERYAQLTAGRAPARGSSDEAVATQLVLARSGARLGDRVALLGADRDGVMNACEVNLVGAMPDAGILATDRKVALVPIAAARELLRMPGRATELAIAIDDPALAEQVASALRQALGADYEVSTWHDLTRAADETMRLQDVAVSFVANAFLLIALLGIANTMLISVRERTREIGTMMAVGIRRRRILALFLLEAGMLGAVGALAGGVIGFLVVRHFGAAGIEMRATGATTVFRLHPWVSAAFVARTFIIAVGGALLAALYPALRASRMRPIEALAETD